mmetsp:Transcript_10872/g.19350  ORF Transcript_10872/g.19350 Transcript_10872/m.19350 type:complete len:682 (-) Transcript_10872:45-2090(-)
MNKVLLFAALLLQHGQQSAATDTICAAQGSVMMQLKHQEESLVRFPEEKNASGSYLGSASCPCIGLNNLSGVTTVVINGTMKVEYPADLGARCAAWDDGLEPVSCQAGQDPGQGNGWCAHKWCFVDPCSCDIPVKPKKSSYLSDGTYQGKPIFYSYATCGGTDTWNGDQATPMTEAEASLCSQNVSDSNYGKDECKCIGIDGEPGFSNVSISGTLVTYPAATGTSCKAWDLENNPDCVGNRTHIPDWCAKAWCYVDPCSCSLAIPPKTSSYLPNASVQGHTVYYSYDSCGSVDSWTAENHATACVNQNSKSDCLLLDKCGWDVDEEVCMGKDILEECISTTTVTTTVQASTSVQKQEAGNRSFGDMKCPCIGLDNISGVTTALILGRMQVDYPADVGAHCAAWDDGRHPTSCKEGADQEPGMGNAWCAEQWCFVDPCNCDIEDSPKSSTYLPEAYYQGKPIFYSYSTCGYADTWKGEAKAKLTVAKEDPICEVAQEPVWGKEECRCIGINGLPGLTNVTISGELVMYPADTGASCKAWDMESHPQCIGKKSLNKPDWCRKQWCYVDPCSCSLATSPKTTAYVPGASFQGRAIYYSYDTCGSVDSWTAENHANACVNQNSSADCRTLHHCGWDGKKELCLGKELLEACPETKIPAEDEKSIAFTLRPALAVMLLASELLKVA